ncbi:activator of HSP90 ATPase [Arthrobacter sp. Soil736]|uniref:SRPBCC family protein n=1 Tax=Arthrobacter sp. Soil736 TaxID=1736395 RepID=UPI0006FD8D01|nr:SRPBCC domain-containing protein [Arthrobacter sp. Soil736]KRE50572.1 activator of HSP90 ATPase [Arthrobacter sp. Soil736]
MNEQPGGLVLNLKCAVSAPRERVFNLLTEPADLVKWWGPHGFTTPEAELNLVVGGGYRFSRKPPDGEEFHLAGEFLEIEPPSRLAYTFRWEEPTPDDRETVVTLTLEALDNGTEVTLAQGTFATAERLELHRSGWTEGFEKLRLLAGSAVDRPQPTP